MTNQAMFSDSTELNAAIDRILTAMSDLEPDTKEYAAMADQLVKLYKLKEIDVKLYLLEQEIDSKNEALAADTTLKDLQAEALREERRFFGVKADTLVLVGANLAGIALILGHERLNVVTTKAIGFVSKLKN
jgi:uncharacterized protein (DUF169 family)